MILNMFLSIFGVIFIVVVVNAGFHHKSHHFFNKHVTYDVNGFKGHHNAGFGMYYGRQTPSPPPMPPFGPYSHHHHHHHLHHHHTSVPEYPHQESQCHHHNHVNEYPHMTPLNPFYGPNIPYNPMHSFNVPNFQPNQYGSNIPNQNIPNNVQNPSTTNAANSFDTLNTNIRPQQGSTKATTNPKSDQNNGNNIAGTGANTFNNNNDNDNMNSNDNPVLPIFNQPESTTPSNRGNNELDYDIDVRFGGSNDRLIENH